MTAAVVAVAGVAVGAVAVAAVAVAVVAVVVTQVMNFVSHSAIMTLKHLIASQENEPPFKGFEVSYRFFQSSFALMASIFLLH